MPASLTEQLREAIVAVLTANSTVATLCGGTARVVDRNTIGPAAALPVVAYEVLRHAPASGSVTLLLTGITEDTNAQASAWDLVDAARTALTQPAFASRGLDVAVADGSAESVTESGDLRELGNPNIRQADWSLPLLVLD